MSEKLKPQMHVGIEYLIKALKLPEEEKIVFLTELFELMYIIKTFVNVAIKHREDRAVVKKAIGAIFLDYGIALAIMVEVILFGIEKQYIRVNSTKERQRNTISVKLGILARHGKLKTNFSNSLDNYVFAN